MTVQTIILLIAIGCIVGTLAGFFGIGGGVIYVPALLLLFEGKQIAPEIRVQLALGTSLFLTVFTSIFSACKHHQQGNVLWKGVQYLVGFSIGGAFVGSYVASVLPGPVVKRIFAFVVLFFSYQILAKKKEYAQVLPRYDLKLIIPVGFMIGFISALVGIGGGIVAIPLMILILKFPINRVAGTSSAIIIFTAFAGVLGYVVNGWDNPLLPTGALGFVYVQMALPFLAGAILFAPIGAKANAKLEPERLKIAFGVFLFLAFVKMVFF